MQYSIYLFTASCILRCQTSDWIRKEVFVPADFLDSWIANKQISQELDLIKKLVPKTNYLFLYKKILSSSVSKKHYSETSFK